MKRIYRMLIIACAVAGLATPAFAGLNAGTKILVHVGLPTTKNQCALVPADCHNAVVTGQPGNFYFIYACIANQDDSVGVAGVQFGVAYNGLTGQGVDVFTWTPCGDMEFAGDTWPQANTGNMITWVKESNCQKGPATAAVGYFYVGVYTPDRFSIIPRPVDGLAKVADCYMVEENLTGVDPSALGYADFGTGIGYNPCSNIVPVEATTWGRVKSLIR